MNNDYTKYDTTVTMTVIVKVPTVIADREDMDTGTEFKDPQFWESMDFSTEANIF